jgi:hypothetical protein
VVGARGAILAHQSNNYIDPVHPWTICRTPVTGLWFVRLDEAAEVDRSVFVVPSMSAHFDYDETDRIEGFTVFDIANHRSAFVAKSAAGARPELGTLKWRPFDSDTPGAAVLAFVEKALASQARGVT